MPASPEPESLAQPSGQLRMIVKLGGAAVTHKQQLETLNGEVLAAAAAQLAALHAAIGPRFVVVHGAGSFGHQQAAAAGVARGGLHYSAAVRRGFAATRASVTRLNSLVVGALLQAGLPAVGVSPCPAWTTRGGGAHVAADGCAGVEALLAAGLIPVLHGDAVLDSMQGCAILSGDVLISRLCRTLRPPVVAFLTNVDGIYDMPPDRPGAQLIGRLLVEPAGSSSSGSSGGGGGGSGLPFGARAFSRQGAPVESLETSAAEHDTTGGVLTKIREAAAVARLGAEVRIARAGSAAAAAACDPAPLPPDWLGTVVQCR